MLLEIPKNRLILLTSILVISALITDNLIINFPIFSISNRDSITVKSIFFLIIGIASFSILYYIRIIKEDTYESSKSRKKTIAQTLLIIMQFSLVLGMFIVVTEIIAFKSYHSISIKFMTILVGIMQFSLFSLLIYSMLRWLLYYRNLLMVIYSILIISFLITSTLLILYINLSLDKRPLLVTHNQWKLTTSVVMFLNIETYYSISYSISFVLMWLVFTFIIKSQTTNINKKRFWILISFPLIYYFGNSELINIIFLVSNISSPIIYFQLSHIALSISTLLGSIIFGITFWLSSRKIYNGYIRKYAYMLSIGITLFFISNQTSPITILYYPPFGLATTIFIGISSYFIVWSIYSATTLISIHKNIQKLIVDTKQDIFLGKITSAHKSQLLHEEVRLVQKKINEFAPPYNILHQRETEEYIKKIIKEKIIPQEKLKQSIGYLRKETPFGKSWEEWVILWYNWNYQDVNKKVLLDETDKNKASIGEYQNNVSFLESSSGVDRKQNYIIPKNKSLFFPVLNSLASIMTQPNLKTEQDLHNYAKSQVNKIKNVYVKLDGKDLTSIIYRISNYFDITIPLNNLELDKNDKNYVRTRAFSDGFWLFIKSLSIGSHILEFGGEQLQFEVNTDDNKTKNEIKRYKIIYNIEII